MFLYYNYARAFAHHALTVAIRRVEQAEEAREKEALTGFFDRAFIEPPGAGDTWIYEKKKALFFVVWALRLHFAKIL